MALDDIVEVTITSATSAPSRVGYGIPLVMTYHTNYTDRAREYTSLASMVTDGFATTDPAYRAVGALLGQNPKPSKVIVGREAGTEEKLMKLTPIAEHSTLYSVVLNGSTASFTSDATATVAEICTGLKTQIDLIGASVVVTDNTTDLEIEAVSVADNFSLYVVSTALFDVNDNTPDGAVTFATDLAAVQVENDDWYTVHLTNQGKAVITAASVYVATLYKILFSSSPDTDIYGSGAADIASVLKTAGYARTVLVYHPKANVQYADCAWAGRCLPLDAGSITWKFKTLTGVDYTTFTTTQESNIRGKNCNMYVSIAGISMMQEGMASSGRFIDLTRGTDWIRSRIQERVFGTLTRSNKVGMTNPGIAAIEADVIAVLSEAVGQTILAADPAPTTQVLDISDVPLSDRATRNLPDVLFTGTYAGAIHSVQISGTLSV